MLLGKFDIDYSFEQVIFCDELFDVFYQEDYIFEWLNIWLLFQTKTNS